MHQSNGWTSVANGAYISKTIHYMVKNFNMKLHVLNCNVLHGKHTAINLAKRYNDIFLEYKLDKKFYVCLVGNSVKASSLHDAILNLVFFLLILVYLIVPLIGFECCVLTFWFDSELH